MENLALVSEITRNIPGVIIGKVKKGIRYRLSYLAVGEAFTMRFWLANETDSSKKDAVNRICDVTDGVYAYNFVAPYDGIITYHINGGKAMNIMLTKI